MKTTISKQVGRELIETMELLITKINQVEADLNKNSDELDFYLNDIPNEDYYLLNDVRLHCETLAKDMETHIEGY